MKSSKPNTQPDPELVRQQKEAQAAAARQKAEDEQRAAEEEAARMRRLRGTRSLLSGGDTGYGLGSSSTLGG